MYEQVLEKQNEEWFVHGIHGADYTVIGRSPHSAGERLAIDEDEILGASEWIRVGIEDLALMVATPIALEIVECIREGGGSIELGDLAEAYKAKVEESLEILAAERAKVNSRRSPSDVVVAERRLGPGPGGGGC